MCRINDEVFLFPVIVFPNLLNCINHTKIYDNRYFNTLAVIEASIAQNNAEAAAEAERLEAIEEQQEEARRQERRRLFVREEKTVRKELRSVSQDDVDKLLLCYARSTPADARQRSIVTSSASDPIGRHTSVIAIWQQSMGRGNRWMMS